MKKNDEHFTCVFTLYNSRRWLIVSLFAGEIKGQIENPILVTGLHVAQVTLESVEAVDHRLSTTLMWLYLRLSYGRRYHSSIHRYRWAFIPEASDDSGLEVRRQGIHQREFKPYVVRLAKLLRKRAKVLHSSFPF